MTDKDGVFHHITLPPGGVQEEVWKRQKKMADESLPPQFAEIVQNTEVPFIQAITDVISPQAILCDGRVLLVGDALAGFRPHTAASTSQAAFDAMALSDLISGTIGLHEWEGRCMDYARSVQRHGVEMGNRSQFAKHPLAV